MRDRLLRDRVDRRREEVVLELVELERGGRPDDRDRALLVEDACELDDDLVVALLSHLGLGHAQLVDAAADDVLGAVERGAVDYLVLPRLRLQHDLDAALQVEAERRLLVDRRAWNREQRDADERSEHRQDENDLRATI